MHSDDGYKLWTNAAQEAEDGMLATYERLKMGLLTLLTTAAWTSPLADHWKHIQFN